MSPTQDLLDALRRRDYSAAQAALEAGADLNGAGAQMREPNLFHLFLTSGGIEQARWLHAHGADVQAVDALGDTALMRLIERNRPNEFAAAMEMGVDVNRANHAGITPVIRAALFGHGLPFLRQLLEAGANPSAVSNARTTGLMAAASGGYIEMARLLFDAGADPRGFDEMGQNIVYASVLSGKPAVLQLVLDRTRQYRESGEIDVDHNASNHSRPLAKAAMFSPEMVLMLLREGAHPDSQSKNKIEPGMAAIHLLAAVDEDGEATLVHEALARGANAGIRDNAGNNAVVYAVAHGLDGKRAVLEALVQAGLDPKAPTGPQALSPIHMALLYEQPLDEAGQPVGPSRLDVLGALIGMGFPTLPRAWVDPKNADAPKPAPPPLVLALARKDLESARVLIELGTSLNELDDRELSVLHRMGAVSGLSEEESMALSITRQRLGRFQQSLEEAVAPDAGPAADGQAPSHPSKKTQARAAEVAGQVQAMEEQARALVATVAKWLSGQGANWNLRGKGGLTPAMCMAREDGYWMLGQVVRFHGADLSLRDERGWTAADHALHAGAIHTLQAIVGHQASAGELSAIQGLLIQAVLCSPEASHDEEGSFQRRAAFLQVLSSLPPDPALLEARDENGNTPLILASATGQDDLVNLFLALGAKPDARNQAGETALLHAASAGESDIVRLLRAAGADTEITSTQGVRARDFVGSQDVRLAAALADPDPAQAPVLEVPPKLREQTEQARRVWESLAAEPASGFDPLLRRRFAM